MHLKSNSRKCAENGMITHVNGLSAVIDTSIFPCIISMSAARDLMSVTILITALVFVGSIMIMLITMWKVEGWQKNTNCLAESLTS